jgi:hypothetical protein
VAGRIAADALSVEAPPSAKVEVFAASEWATAASLSATAWELLMTASSADLGVAPESQSAPADQSPETVSQKNRAMMNS